MDIPAGYRKLKNWEDLRKAELTACSICCKTPIEVSDTDDHIHVWEHYVRDNETITGFPDEVNDPKPEDKKKRLKAALDDQNDVLSPIWNAIKMFHISEGSPRIARQMIDIDHYVERTKILIRIELDKGPGKKDSSDS